MSTQVVPHPVAIIGDIIAGVAILGWWLGAYEAHIGSIVTTMAGVYYLVQFGKWVASRFNNDGD